MIMVIHTVDRCWFRKCIENLIRQCLIRNRHTLFYITIISFTWLYMATYHPCKTYYGYVKHCMTVTNKALENENFNTF